MCSTISSIDFIMSNNQTWTTVEHKRAPRLPKGDRPTVTPSAVPSVSTYDAPTVLKKKTGPATEIVRSVDTKTSNKDVSKYRNKVEETAEGDGPMSIKKFPADFRKKVCDARKTLGLKQEEFAAKIGVKPSVIKDIEQNVAKYDPTLKQRIDNAIQRLTKHSKA